MNWLELEVLEGSEEAVKRHQELLVLLAKKLNVKPNDVFATWMRKRGGIPQHGQLTGSPWMYFFHGCECDFRNKDDGRFVRLDFGPGGRSDVVTAWGVLQFIMTSASPWPEFPELKTEFTRSAPPFDEYSGDLIKFGEVWDRLEQEKCLEIADPQLLDLLKRSTTIGDDGIGRVQFPEGTSEKTRIDCSVVNRQRISACGRQLLETHRAVSHWSSEKR